jgi:predicted alpha/beta-hydrolase family hydrolase
VYAAPFWHTAAVALRRLRIQWAPGEKVSGLLTMPARPRPIGVLLAHGAGAGQTHPFLVHLRAGLGAAGFPTLTFDYPYVEAGRRAPDRLPRLLDTHRAAAARLASYVEGVVLAGKSMGGRVASHLAGDDGWPARGLVYYGYPLVPLGSKPPRPTDHLARIAVPQLFFAGTRDRLSPPELLRGLVAALPAARIEVIEHADHGFHVPQRLGMGDEEIRDRLVGATADWIRDLR